MQGVVRTAESATLTARRLLDLFQNDREKLHGESATVLRLHAQLQQKPVLSVSAAARELEVTHPTATKALRTLDQKQIVSEITGSDYRRVYTSTHYLKILNEGESTLD